MLARIITPVLLSFSVSAHAGVILGGSTLIDNTGLLQLEDWMGGGTLTLTNIFTKPTTPTNATAFHKAVDGKGATITVMRASEGTGPVKIIGGYNPLSWDSITGMRYTPDPLDWTAFIFNLTDHIKKQQTEKAQTRNSPGYGPTFGGGNDIVVAGDLTWGGALGYSYGDGCNATGYCGSDYRKSIIDGSNYNKNDMVVHELEVFAVQYSPEPHAKVPEPSTLALAGFGLLGMTALRRRKQAGGGR